MTPASRESLLALAAALALAVPGALVTGRVLDGLGRERPFDVDAVPQASALSMLSPGLKLSVADYYWLLAVQYIGEGRREQRGFEKLFPLVDLITDLDPGHGYAYQTAGIVLSAQKRLEESDRILEKGMQPGRPGWWTYPFYRAFNDYFYRGDYVAAAAWAERAARTPGASPHISHLAMSLRVKSGDPAEALSFIDAMRAEVSDPEIGAALEEQRQLALLQVRFAELDRAVARYRERHGRAPARLEALVEDGLLPALPDDPYGGHFSIDAAGVVHESVNDRRFRPAEPGQLQLEKTWAPPVFKESP